MNRIDDLEIRLRDWMVVTAPEHEPVGLVERSVAGLDRVRQQPRVLVRTGLGRSGSVATAFSPAWRLAFLGLLPLAVAAAAAIIGSQLIAPPQPSPFGRFVEGPALPFADARYDDAVALQDGRMLILAYESDEPRSLLLDPATGAMQRAADPPQAFFWERPSRWANPHVLADGRVLFVGGGSPDTDQQAALYDPATDTFRTIGPTAAPRFEPLMVTLADGKVLVAGGEVNGAVATAELFDPVTETFSATGPMTRPRGFRTGSALLPDGRVLVVGGAGAEVALEASAELFDPQTGTFSTTGSLVAPRDAFTTTSLPDGRVLLAGGLIRTGETTYASAVTAEIYDPATGRFSTTGPLSQSRTMHAAAVMPDGTVLVVGGAARGSDANPSFNPLRTAEVYDPATGLFTPVGLTAHPRLNPIAVPTADGRVLVLGHLDPRGGRLPTAEDRLRGRTSEWFLPPAR